METTNKFSALNRQALLTEMAAKEFDLLIIGGGITGAGIALDAVSRGLSVALVEKQDFAGGTSSRSTKLVHGGLRYLEQMAFGLVAKTGRERKIVQKNAPHLVIPQKIMLPVLKNGKLTKFTARLALSIYDALAGVKKHERNQITSKKASLQFEPLLNSNLLKGAGIYYEYKVDDSRLTIEALKKAVELGAFCVNYAKAEQFITEDNQVKGAVVNDSINQNTYTIKSKVIVNATGAWVDTIRKIDNSLTNKRLHLTKGIHIVVSWKRFPIRNALYFDVSDGRMIFVIPKTNIVYIGTTDTDYNAAIDTPDVTIEDVNYLLKAVNQTFLSVKLVMSDILSSWAGLRPLIHQEGKSPSELSRRDEIFYSPTGLISIAGGKLTGYRLMAKKTTDIVIQRLQQNNNNQYQSCTTANLRLSGGNFPFPPTMSNLVEYADHKYDEAKHTGISVEDFKLLFYRYGMNIDKITEKVYELWNTTPDKGLLWLKSELWYSINYEMTANLNDYYIRRTGDLLFRRNTITNHLQYITNETASLLKWSEKQTNTYLNEFKANYNKAVNFQHTT